MVVIDYVKCNGVMECAGNGVCVEVCGMKAISVDGEKPVVDIDRCPDCGLCIMNCPVEAIHL